MTTETTTPITIHYDVKCRYCAEWATQREKYTYADGRMEEYFYCARCKSAI